MATTSSTAAAGWVQIESNSYDRAGVPAAVGAAYYVDRTRGSDSNPGSYQQPWQTIQKAANVMGPGDVVTVNAGDYPERVVISRSGNASASITFKARGIVKVRGFTVRGDYIRIEGFGVDLSANRTCNWSATDYGIAVYGDHSAIINNDTAGSGHGGIILMPGSDYAFVSGNVSHQDGGNGIVIYGTNHLVENNEISDVRCAPCAFNDANGMHFHGSGHTIRRNYIHDIGFSANPGYTPHIDAFQTFADANNPAAQNVIIERNRVRFVEGAKDGATTVYGFMVANATDLTIRSNVIEAWGGYNTGFTGPNHNIRIYNNTFCSRIFYQHSPLGIRVTNTQNVWILNNITVDFANLHYVLSGSNQVSYSYNLMWNSNGSAPGLKGYVVGPSDKYGVNPSFVNSGADFHLKSSSPAVNVGYNIGYWVPTDYDGTARPQGSRYDIGAYEYSGSPPQSAIVPAVEHSFAVFLPVVIK